MKHLDGKNIMVKALIEMLDEEGNKELLGKMIKLVPQEKTKEFIKQHFNSLDEDGRKELFKLMISQFPRTSNK